MSPPADFTVLDYEADAKMQSYDERLASFENNWPFDSNCNCSAEKVGPEERPS